MTREATHEHQQLEALTTADPRHLPFTVSQFIFHCQEKDEFNIPFSDTERKRLNNYYHLYA